MPIACDVFERLRVVSVPLGGTQICWKLRDGFVAQGPFYFYVETAPSGSTEWTPINDEPLVDICCATDTYQRYYDQLSYIYYRVRLVLPTVPDANTGLPTEYVSQPQQGNGTWSRRDWLISRDIIRREYLVQRKRHNITSGGYLLKRRRWGTPCPLCLDYDTGGTTQSQSCTTCFGTGFVGGYFPAIDYRFTFEALPQRRIERNEQVGQVNPIVKQARGVCYPHVDSHDIYARTDTGERYVIQNVSNLAEYGGVPLVIRAELRLAPVTDILYTVLLDPVRTTVLVRPDGSSIPFPEDGSPGDPKTVSTQKSGVVENGEW